MEEFSKTMKEILESIKEISIWILQGIKKATAKTREFFAKNENARLIAVLAIITSTTAMLLGIINTVTAPKIEQIQIENTEKALSQLLLAEFFEPIEILEGSDETIKEFYRATSNGEIIGYSIKVTPMGYNGPIEMMVAFDKNGSVIGTEILSMSETKGLGTKIEEDASFAKQFIGKNSEEIEVIAISGATVSSKAMAQGVSNAISFLIANK